MDLVQEFQIVDEDGNMQETIFEMLPDVYRFHKNDLPCYGRTIKECYDSLVDHIIRRFLNLEKNVPF